MCRACSIASARSSRACSSPSMATGTTARRSRSGTRSRRSWRGCPRSSTSSSFRTSNNRATARATRPRCAMPSAGIRSSPRTRAAASEFVRLPFDHPLYILYSSGTTGEPKCIVHGAGGTLLQHLKEHLLHGDLKAGDRLFYFTTCGWMMWNWLASGLGAGATLLLYDGSPFVDRGKVLWDFAEDERITHFGTSAKYIDHAKKLGVVPRKDYELAHLRTLFSTGSPLAPESFDYVYQCVKDDLCLSSISGGTDIVSCFALGCPTLPVWRGELQCRGARDGRSTCSTTTAGRFRGGKELRASSSARRPFRRCRSASGTIPGGVEIPGHLFRAVSRRVVSRRLRRADRARRPDLLRPLGRHAQSRRRAHRHRGNLPAGRTAARGRREPRDRPGLAAGRGRRRARDPVRAAAGRPDARRGARRPDQAAHPRQHDAAARAGQGPAGDGHSPHQEQQDRRARRAQRRPRAAREEPWKRWPIPKRSSSTATATSSRRESSDAPSFHADRRPPVAAARRRHAGEACCRRSTTTSAWSPASSG